MNDDQKNNRYKIDNKILYENKNITQDLKI